jgi:hypothetical protein
MTTTLTPEQRDALRNLADAEKHYTGRVVQDAARRVLASFADALRPPKMATRWHKYESTGWFRVARTPDGDLVEFKSFAGRISPEFSSRARNNALLAAARDPEFHEVDD